MQRLADCWPVERGTRSGVCLGATGRCQDPWFGLNTCCKRSTPVAADEEMVSANARTTTKFLLAQIKHLKLTTKSAQSSASENTSRESGVSALAAKSTVVSLHPITPEYNNKYWPKGAAENSCFLASGGSGVCYSQFQERPHHSSKPLFSGESIAILFQGSPAGSDLNCGAGCQECGARWRWHRKASGRRSG